MTRPTPIGITAIGTYRIVARKPLRRSSALCWTSASAGKTALLRTETTPISSSSGTPVGERVDAECGIAEELADDEVVEVGNQGVNCVGTKQGESEPCHGPEHCG